jgi:hypothetical protein
MVGDTGIEPVTSSVSGTGTVFADIRLRASVQVTAARRWSRNRANTSGHDRVGVRVGVRARRAVEVDVPRLGELMHIAVRQDGQASERVRFEAPAVRSGLSARRRAGRSGHAHRRRALQRHVPGRAVHRCPSAPRGYRRARFAARSARRRPRATERIEGVGYTPAAAPPPAWSPRPAMRRRCPWPMSIASGRVTSSRMLDSGAVAVGQSRPMPAMTERASIELCRSRARCWCAAGGVPVLVAVEWLRIVASWC